MRSSATRSLRALIGGSCVALLAACASAPPPAPPSDAVFYPPAPELPRLQYLTSFNSSKDVQVQSQFDKFVVGEQPDLRLQKPYGVASRDGRVYVCDTMTTVLVFDTRNHSFAPLAGAQGEGRLLQPVNVSVDADGTKYVADPARGQVVAYGRDDQYLRAFGTPGNWRPVDAVAYQGRLYVADLANAVVKVFDLANGEPVATIGDKGTPEERLAQPTNLAFDAAGFLYVSDVGRFQVAKYDRDGHFKAKFGDPGDSVGHFARPKGIAVDRQGRLFVVDAAFNNVQLFNPDGRVLMAFGNAGDKPGTFQLPAKIAIDYDSVADFQKYAAPGFRIEYLVLVTSQFGPHLVNVFGYGAQEGRKYPSDAELLAQIDARRKEEIAKAEEAAKKAAAAKAAEEAKPAEATPPLPDATVPPAPEPAPESKPPVR